MLVELIENKIVIFRKSICATLFYPKERECIIKPLNLEILNHLFDIQTSNFESNNLQF